MSVLVVAMAVLVLAAGLVARRRVRRARRDQELTDEMIRRIEREGSVRFEQPEPLDLEEIRREEREFWEQSWDEPEPL